MGNVVINNDLLIHAIENFRGIKKFLRVAEWSPYMICACKSKIHVHSIFMQSLEETRNIPMETTTIHMREVQAITEYGRPVVIGSLGFCPHCRTLFHNDTVRTRHGV